MQEREKSQALISEIQSRFFETTAQLKEEASALKAELEHFTSIN
jgi:hypothetical protein